MRTRGYCMVLDAAASFFSEPLESVLRGEQ